MVSCRRTCTSIFPGFSRVFHLFNGCPSPSGVLSTVVVVTFGVPYLVTKVLCLLTEGWTLRYKLIWCHISLDSNKSLNTPNFIHREYIKRLLR